MSKKYYLQRLKTLQKGAGNNLVLATFNVDSIVNKTVAVLEQLADQKVDICLVQDPLLREADTAKVQEIKRLWLGCTL